MVDFNPNLLTQKEKDDFKIELGSGSEVLSGDKNGLSVILDVETFDHGYVPAKGRYSFYLIDHQHKYMTTTFSS